VKGWRVQGQQPQRVFLVRLTSRTRCAAIRRSRGGSTQNDTRWALIGPNFSAAETRGLGGVSTQWRGRKPCLSRCFHPRSGVFLGASIHAPDSSSFTSVGRFHQL